MLKIMNQQDEERREQQRLLRQEQQQQRTAEDHAVAAVATAAAAAATITRFEGEMTDEAKKAFAMSLPANRQVKINITYRNRSGDANWKTETLEATRRQATVDIFGPNELQPRFKLNDVAVKFAELNVAATTATKFGINGTLSSATPFSSSSLQHVIFINSIVLVSHRNNVKSSSCGMLWQERVAGTDRSSSKIMVKST